MLISIAVYPCPQPPFRRIHGSVSHAPMFQDRLLRVRHQDCTVWCIHLKDEMASRVSATSLSWANRHVENPETVVKPGDEVFVKVGWRWSRSSSYFLVFKQATDSVDPASEDFDPALYGMPAEYDENGNALFRRFRSKVQRMDRRLLKSSAKSGSFIRSSSRSCGKLTRYLQLRGWTCSSICCADGVAGGRSSSWRSWSNPTTALLPNMYSLQLMISFLQLCNSCLKEWTRTEKKGKEDWVPVSSLVFYVLLTFTYIFT